MSGNLFIGPQEQTALRLAVEAARKNPVPIAEIMQYKIPQAAFMVELSDRKGTPPGRHSQHVLLPIGYRVSISFEEQPAGICLHLSMSTSAAGMVPHPAAVRMVLDAIGITGALDDFRTWLEEFEPGQKAVNVVILMAPAQEGHG